MTDQHFTQLADRFCDRIYGTEKGQIRIRRLWDSMCRHLPTLSEGLKEGLNESGEDREGPEGRVIPLRILDMGGGAGHIAKELCAQGHHVTLVEPAEEMVAFARHQLVSYIETGQAEVFQSDLNQFRRSESQYDQYDIVLFHAVLEWLADPQSAIALLKYHLKPSGYLSLMFYNRNALTIKNLLKGNFYRVKQAVIDGQWGGDPGSLTPNTPLDPQQVYEWVEDAGLQRTALTGIRSFYDYIPKTIQQSRSREDVLELEALFSEQEPFLSMSRYIHLVARTL